MAREILPTNSGAVAVEAPPVKPVKSLSVKPKIAALAAARVTERYWVGLTRECPVEQVAAGPITIMKKTFSSKPGPTGEFEYDDCAGSIMKLTAADLKLVLDTLETRGLDVSRDENGSIGTASVAQLGPGMEPVAKYVYIAKLEEDDEAGNYWGRPLPKPLFTEGA